MRNCYFRRLGSEMFFLRTYTLKTLGPFTGRQNSVAVILMGLEREPGGDLAEKSLNIYEKKFEE